MRQSISRSRRQGRGGPPLLGRLSLSLLPLALTAGLVGSGIQSAAAAEPTGGQVQPTTRERALTAWLNGGPRVHELAEAALAGSEQDVKRFVDNDLAGAQRLDDLLAATQISSVGGPKVREAADKAIEGTPDELRTFLQSGWQAALDADRRLMITRITDPAMGPGRNLQAAGDAALRGNTSDDLQRFLTEGQYPAKDADDRLKLVQILSSGGTNTQAAARAALNGSIQDVRDFLATGQYIAQSRDQERASIALLVQQAKDAGAQAAQETAAAVEAKDKAVHEAQKAMEAAALAASETQKAGNDAAKATEAANKAATAAERAGAAAQTAMAAARAANAGARAAAYAASNAAAAAAGAQRAAANAETAAAAAAGDATKAHDARVAADAATAAAKLAAAANDTLVKANESAKSSKDAAGAALSAKGNADAAAGSAEQAGAYADSAGGQSAKAKQAAAATRRSAAEAGRAAAASQQLAGEAATQAEAAATLLKSAGEHAEAAAQAARDAADHAGQSGNAAQESTNHANAASAAAADAQRAVDQANTLQDLTRRTEAEDLTNRIAAAVEKARQAKADETAKQTQADQAAQEVRKARTEADRLAQAVNQPGATPEQVATDGRKLAILSRKISGPWGTAAAQAALVGNDSAVLGYVRTERRAAEARDDHDRASQIYEDDDNEAVRNAAYTALQGGADQVGAFLDSGQYEAAAPANRLTITRLSDKAGPAVKAAADTALRTNTPTALRDFLAKGLADAQAADDRLTATRLEDAPATEPELKAAARVALEGPVLKLRAFVAEGQYTAQQKDRLTAVHVADVKGLIAEATAASASAQKNAATAQAAAAYARGVADEARGYEATAKASADTAAQHVATAQAAADAAQADATKAAAAAKTANAAKTSANRDAASAMYSARQAEQSAGQARFAASNAYTAANAARASAEAAGKDATAADQAQKEAFASYQTKYDAEEKARLARLEAERKEAEKQARDARQKQETISALEEEIKKQKENSDNINAVYRLFSESIHLTLDVIGGAGGVIAPGLADIADLVNCAYYAIEGRTQDAYLSCISAIPLVGDGAAVAKFAQWAKKFGSWGEKAAEFIKKLVGRLPKTCPVNSFPAGTRVLMGDGSTRPIESVKVGDEVLAGDPTTGLTAPRRVSATIYTPDDRDFTDVSLGAGQSLTSTDHHPFWAENQKQWVDAADLRTGDELRDPAGRPQRIEDVRHWNTLQAAYNLTVDDLHTYYVLAGETPVLVHNTEVCGVALGIRKEGDLRNFADTNGYEHFLDKTYNDAVAAVRDVAHEQPGRRIYVVLDGFRMSNGKPGTPQELFEDFYKEGRAGLSSITTQQEMNILGESVRLGNRSWDSITFRYGGKDIKLSLPDFNALRAAG
ncbi:polymorphic toxin-type HINT domain-containing protein [Kitasatospora sp. NPDC056800]|uniref:polymorphic toxin-type HINT domain-containing protein n=1 Tax=Kitasatospora sp. NPDC056800 TaxID=3345948 RepID=UPI00367C1282